MQQLKPLRQKLHIECGYAREIAAWTVQGGDEPQLNRIECGREDYRDSAGCRLCRLGEIWFAAITSAWRRTRSAASAGSRSYCSSAQRYSTATFLPSI